MKDTDKDYCRILLDVLEAGGVEDVIASPGSRNAPLLISCSYRNKLKTHVITDERTAGFLALGIATVKRKPVILICTSGTALYNYAPAMAEAFYQKIPLIVISADRPFQWIDQNDSQTLVQPGALDKIVKKAFDIPVQSGIKELEWYVERIANETLCLTAGSDAAPVHINVQIDSPISNTVDLQPVVPRVVEIIKPNQRFSPNDLNHLASRLSGRKVLVVAGYMAPNAELNKYLSLFSTLPGVKILCETISNLHLDGNPYAIDTVISGLTAEQKDALQPEIVISIGGALVSRMLKEYIRERKPEVWTLSDSDPGIDCFKSLTLHVDAEPAFFFKAMYITLKKLYDKKPELSERNKEYKEVWKRTAQAQIKIREDFTDDSDWSELKAFRYIFSMIPRSCNLFLSNGTSVRYAQLFSEQIPHASYSNRGVSGIDGTNATAAGCAMAYKGPTLLITGDMSFAYCPGIMGIEGLPSDFKIIVINNRGGGIFRFISPTRYIEHRDHFFCADPKVPFQGLALAYKWNYYYADSEETIEQELVKLLSSPTNALLEVCADEEYSASLLRKYMRLNGLNQ